jgi:signal transduction histidine kinase
LEERVVLRTVALEHTNAALAHQAEERLNAEQAREQLLERLVSVQEEERRRISRELHDQMGQQLTALLMGMHSLPEVSDPGIRSPSYPQQVEKLRALATASADVIYRMNPDWSEMHELDGRGLLPGTPEASGSWLERYIPPDDRAQVRGAIEAAVREKRVFELEHRTVRADGTLGWTLSRAVPMLDERGEIVEWVGAASDVTARKEAEAALRELNEMLEQRVRERTAELVRASEARRQVLQQLVTAEEEERRRISRELHDQMGQHLTGLLLGLRAARSEAEAHEVVERLDALERLAAETARDVQSMAVELRPPALDTLGLVAAVQSHLEDWGERHGVEYDFHSAGLAGLRLARDVETTLYRVVQEGLNNVLKHAGASRVSLLIERRDDVVRLILEDDGGGFDVEATLARPDKAKRLGVRGMRERLALLGGELEIESSPGSGTALFVRLPATPSDLAGE